MSKTPVQRVIGIDWSGRIDPSGQRRHIWAGVWTMGADGKTSVKLEAGRTRDEVGDWLIELAGETPRVVIGIDCCFSYPGWFLAEHGCTNAFDFWRHVAAGHGERWLARECEGRRFWGKPHKRPAEFCGEGLRRMMRLTDWDNKIAQAQEGGDPQRAVKMIGITPKSPFQIGGSGSVGTGSLRAMPFLLRLHEAGFRVWPFEEAQLQGTASRSPAGMATGKTEAKPLLVEIYTRLLTGAVAKSNPEARKAYLAAKRKTDSLYAEISRGVFAKAQGSEDAFDALVSTLEMVRHADEFAKLHETQDEVLRLEGITWRPGVKG